MKVMLRNPERFETQLVGKLNVLQKLVVKLAHRTRQFARMVADDGKDAEPHRPALRSRAAASRAQLVA